jgi:hypothetical protein
LRLQHHGILTVLRSIAAVVAGYLAMTLVVIAGYATLRMTGQLPGPDQPLTTGYLGVSLVISAFAAFTGGLLCATVAGDRPLQHAGFLAFIATLIGLQYTRSLWNASGPQAPPHGYLGALLLLTPVLVLLGAFARKKLREAAGNPPE